VRWIPFYDHHPLNVPDILVNVVLFLPFGYLFPREFRGSTPRRSLGVPILMALTLSTAVELFQVYTHDRIPSTTDICTNLLGAVLGFMIEQWQ
jgi:glycopeptide antibiotics resistance protein